MRQTSWKLTEWNEYFANKAGVKLPLMSHQDVLDGINWLRGKNYPKPSDCPGKDCPDFRPACNLGTCKIAVMMCGDF